MKLNTFLVLLVLSIFATGQDLSVKAFKDKFKEAGLVFEEFRTVFEYSLDDEGKFIVTQKDNLDLLQIRSGSRETWPIFYNDQIQITDFSVKNKKKRKHSFTKTCGHFSSGSIFHSDARLCTYTFSAGMVGEPLYIETGLKYQDPRYLTRIPFMEFIPGKKRIIEIIWPEWVKVELAEFNFDGHDVNKTVTESEYGTKVIYELQWLDRLPRDEDKPHIAHYIPHIIPQTISYQRPQDQEPQIVLEDVGDLYQWYRELSSGTKNEPDSIRTLVSDLTTGKQPKDQIKSIYYWVQDNIKYIAFEEGIMGFQPMDAQEVLYKRYGDCKGMANLLKTMLNLAGFDARLTWLGTTHLPYTYDLPSLGVDNHMICTLIDQEGNFQVLDATAKFTEIGYAPFHIQGKEILIEDGENYRIETIPVADQEVNYERFRMDISLDQDKIVGDGIIEFEGDSKQLMLMMLNNLDKKYHDRVIRNIVAYSADSDDFNVDILAQNRDSTLRLKVHHELDENVRSFGEDLYVDIEFRKELANLKIDKTRKAPYDLNRRRYLSGKISMEIPEGFEVKTLPAAFSESNELVDFAINYSLEGNIVQYEKSLIIGQSIIPVNQFDMWNASIKALKEYYNQPIVLSKKSQ